jgi:lysozyme
MDKLKNLIRSHEGYRRFVYRCPAGFATVGIGRNIDQGGKGVSEEESLFLLEQDVSECIDDLSSFSWWHDLNDARQAALVDMRFNLGPSRFRRFKKMIAAIDDGDFREAARQMLDSRAAQQTGSRYVTLAKMLSSGKWGL